MTNKTVNPNPHVSLKSRLGRILTHSAFIAAVMGAVTFYLIDFSPDPYLLQIERTTAVLEPPLASFPFYADLNSDGRQEMFKYGNENGINAQIVAVTAENVVLDQWVFLGLIDSNSVGYFIGNYDHDSSLEIACFSLKENAIYLNIIEPYGDTTHLVKNLPVDTVWTSEYIFSLTLCGVQFCDLNRDGFDELLFSLHSGRALQPRKTYAYDIRADSLWSSPLAGTIYNEMFVFDLDRDGRIELFCKNAGSSNYSGGAIPCLDTSSWFAVLDERLQYKIPPVQAGGAFSRIAPIILEMDGKSVLYMMVTEMQHPDRKSAWYLVNPDFSLQPADPFPDSPDLTVSLICNSSTGKGVHFCDASRQKRFTLLNGRIVDISSKGYGENYVPIVNFQAGIPQFDYAGLVDGEQNSIRFFNQSGKKLGSVELSTADGNYRICWAGMENGHHQFLLSGQKHEYWISVRANPWQYWQYLILIALIGGYYGFISLIRLIQTRQIALQDGMRREVLELQLRAVRNQLDPHFTFNALNTLSGLSQVGDKNGVDHFINHFSRLLRTHLQTSDKILVPLKEEIEFVVSYVELQRIRFDNAFRLDFDIPQEIDLGRLIPKMMVHTHVENAIKHGLKDSMAAAAERPDVPVMEEGSGRVWVKVREEGNSLIIMIEDNGVGRGYSQVPKQESTGIGLMSLERIAESVRQLYGIRIRQEVEDLYSADRSPAGTRVTIRMEK